MSNKKAELVCMSTSPPNHPKHPRMNWGITSPINASEAHSSIVIIQSHNINGLDTAKQSEDTTAHDAALSGPGLRCCAVADPPSSTQPASPASFVETSKARALPGFRTGNKLRPTMANAPTARPNQTTASTPKRPWRTWATYVPTMETKLAMKNARGVMTAKSPGTTMSCPRAYWQGAPNTVMPVSPGRRVAAEATHNPRSVRPNTK
mmetsp:Transcript_16335/g.48653  ORF Transcript_16335/g.48653 Transcript_16335/m.48653 type:complete len:207 (-) Transcript_16335:411-1031(-)